jgi:Protein of unknown function (DUF3422)
MTSAIYDELHARPAVEIDAPALVTHLAYMTGDSAQPDNRRNLVERRRQIVALIRQVYAEFGYRVPADIAKLDEYDSGDDEFSAQKDMLSHFRHQETLIAEDKKCVIQNHTEFLSITFMLHRERLTKSEWSAIPKTVVSWRTEDFIPDVASHIRLEKNSLEEDASYNLAQIFNGQFQKKFLVHDIYRDLLASRVSDGALVWTPFRPFEDGFNRMLVHNVDLSRARTGRLIQRLVEIDTYVFMALLGLSSARTQLRTLRTHQNELSSILSRKPESKKDQRGIYERLSELSQFIGQDIASTRYRFFASRAYADIVWERVEQLREQKVTGWSRIGYFLDRTFRPAIQTCDAALNFQNAISQSIEQAAGLLGAGVSIDLELEGKTIERRMLYLTIAILVMTGLAALYYGSHVLHDWGFIVLPGLAGHG